MPNAIELLEQDHRAVEQLFTEFASSLDRGVAKRICDELTIHAEVEEQVVYPVLSREVSAEKAEEAEEEHAEASELIAQLRALSADDARYVPVMTQLQEAVQHHVEEEETEVFPEMEQQLGPDRLAAMGEEIVRLKEELSAMAEGPGNVRAGHEPVDRTNLSLDETSRGLQGATEQSGV
jgi:hemerythrin-like domain-containing protein